MFIVLNFEIYTFIMMVLAVVVIKFIETNFGFKKGKESLGLLRNLDELNVYQARYSRKCFEILIYCGCMQDIL